MRLCIGFHKYMYDSGTFQGIQEKEKRKEEAKERKELAEHKKLITAIKVGLILNGDPTNNFK